MIWIYGICDRPDLRAPECAGLEDAPVEALSEGGLVAMFTRHERLSGGVSAEALWEHERVVEHLMLDRTVVPMRFGSHLDDDPALREFLVESEQHLLGALERIAGRVELGVRALQSESADVVPPVPLTGRDYLLAKLDEGRRAQRAASSLHLPLAALSSDARQRPPRRPDELLHGSYLVNRRTVPRFRAEVTRLQSAHADVALLCTGPWPAYSFVGGDG